MLAAEFGVGQVLWSLVYIFFVFMAIWLVISVVGDVFRSDDLSGVSKAVWTLLIVFLPFIGVLSYLIVRGQGMAERDAKSVQARETAMQEYIQRAAGTTAASPAEQIATLSELHTAGKLDDAEFASAKAKVLAG